jgi:hypothetical protein
MSGNHRLLRDIVPEFAGELADVLNQDGFGLLAIQIPSLELWQPCGCQAKSCCSFYTGSKPSEPWAKVGNHYNVVPNVRKGLVVLDVVDGVIRYLEIPDRPDLRKLLFAVT